VFLGQRKTKRRVKGEGVSGVGTGFLSRGGKGRVSDPRATGEMRYKIELAQARG